MKKLLWVLPFMLGGCETMNSWMDSAGDYMPDMPTVTNDSGMSKPQSQSLQETNTNMYSVPPQ